MDINSLKKGQTSVKAKIRRQLISILADAETIDKKELFSSLYVSVF